MIPLWLLVLLLDTALLFILGILDYKWGESPGELTLACYASALAVYPFLPVPAEIRALMFLAHLAIAGVMVYTYLRGELGLMDFVVAPNVPLLMIIQSPYPIILGFTAAAGALLLHTLRSRGMLCNARIAIPGAIVEVKSSLAWDKWYFFPVDVKAEAPEEEIMRIKEKWRKKNGCVKARFVIPFVWVYAVFHTVAFLSWLVCLYV